MSEFGDSGDSDDATAPFTLLAIRPSNQGIYSFQFIYISTPDIQQDLVGSTKFPQRQRER